MPLITNNLNNYVVKNNQVVLNKDYLRNERWKFKKITGSRFASVLNKNKYSSPFQIWMTMVNLYKDDMDPTLAQAGNVIEPKIREYASQKLNIRWKVYDPREIKWDAFKENKIFGGIPDGEPINEKQLVDYSTNQPMLEVKTSSIDSLVFTRTNNQLRMQKDIKGVPFVKEKGAKKASWCKEGCVVIPEEYALQLGLYLYLRHVSYGVFAIGFLEPNDYAHPEHFLPDEHDIRLVDFKIDLTKFQPLVGYAEKWYKEHIETGISPTMTDNDRKWLDSEFKGIR